MKDKKKKGIVPQWQGNLPMPPNKKKPALVRHNDAVSALYGFSPDHIYAPKYISTDKITMGLAVIPPGRTHEGSIGRHVGDEVYFVKEGIATVMSSAKGDVAQAKAGSAIYNPKGTWHQLFNFGTEYLKIISTHAPTMYSPDDMGSEIKFPGTPKFYKYKADDTYKPGKVENKTPGIDWSLLKADSALDLLGRFPMPGSQARKTGKVIAIPEDRMLRLIHGKDSHMLVSFFISNDFTNVGIISLSEAFTSAVEVHKGDEAIHVLEGTLILRIKMRPEDYVEASTFHSSYEIKKDETFLIPEGMLHQYVNLTDRSVKFLFAVAPAL